MTKRFFTLTVLLVVPLLFQSCTKLNKDLPTPVSSETKIHEKGWIDTASTKFHGKYLLINNLNSASCKQCHSSGFTGGTSNVSCFTCHNSFPHPAEWDSTFTGFRTDIKFHGTFLRMNNWQFDSCKTCHGTSFAGGNRVEVSCMSSGCHQDDMGMQKPPTACNTCHGNFRGMENDTFSWAPPRTILGDTSGTTIGVGAHQPHLTFGTFSNKIPCATCHNVPAIYSDAGHLGSDNRAEITFVDSLAFIVTNESTTTDYDNSLSLFSPLPVYNNLTSSCSSTYCHGNFKNGNPAFAPVWNDTTGAQTVCGTCHGDTTRSTLADRALPKGTSQGGTHPSANSCFACHGEVVDANLNFVNKTKHINGKLNVFNQERDF
ncbi:MAG: CxxxxCH/CxxCH domain-containing protein [Ignavibacteriales bacterium]|nr:CxxxxCH/CxxCH domain-containing protein [Ignavibacteriales bacterium]